jgi:hypothetical protein
MYGTTSGNMLGTRIPPRTGAKIWIIALIQFAIATIFLLVFRFPKIIIVFFGVMIVLGTALSAWARTRPALPRPTPQPPVAHPVLYKIVSLIIAICSLAFFATLLFGFVIFINNWNDWHRYQGQPYHVSTFLVTRTYFQRVGKGGIDAYASGTVEGNREWMNLRPYLNTIPRSQEELDEHVSAGTSIPIYLFPEMKGRLRVRVYNDTPPAEAYHHAAMNALNYGLGGLALCAAMIFVLSRLRRMCYVKTEPAIPEVAVNWSR